MSPIVKRPSMFGRVPAVPVVVTVALGAGAGLLLRYTDLAVSAEAFAAFAGVLAAVGIAFTGALSRWRAHDYERVNDAVSCLVSAWEALGAETGISWALWANLRMVHQPSLRGGGERARVEKALAELLTLGVAPVPTTPEEHRWWRQDRYYKTYTVNRLLVTGRRARRHHDRFKREAVSSTHVRLLATKTGWDQAIAHLRASAAAERAILDRVEQVTDLVGYWWIHAVNDPFYWNVDTDVFDTRVRMFRDAKDAVYGLRDAVQTRQLGQGPVRYGLQRLVHGRG